MGEMIQWAKMLAAKLEDLSSVPRTTWWKAGAYFSKLSSFHRHTHDKQIKNENII